MANILDFLIICDQFRSCLDCHGRSTVKRNHTTNEGSPKKITTELSIVLMRCLYSGCQTISWDQDQGKKGGALSNKQKMEVCLRYMADPGFQNGVSEVVGISQPTVSRTVKQVVEKICLKSNRWIIFPGNQRAVNELSTLWILSRKLPGCFGAVDGSLIKVQVPPSTSYTPQDFHSGRKKVYCLNVMLVCSADCKFIAVDARWLGRAHDARVWRTSDVHARLTNGVSGDKYLIGDIQ